MSNDKAKTQIISPEALISYPHVDKPQPPQKPGDEPMFSAAFIFLDGTDMSGLVNAAIAAADAKWPGKGAELLRLGAIRTPFRTDGTLKGYPAGSIYINARSKNKPGAVYAHADPDDKSENPKPQKISDEKLKQDLYPGARVRVSLNAYAYDKAGNKGVTFALNNIQKLGDGPRIDSRRAAEDEFTADLASVPTIADLAKLGL